MDFICPTCGKRLPRELRLIIPHTEEHIIDALKKRYPRWVEKDGTCRKCYAHYKKEIEKGKW